ncbi:MAG: hypothetical protein OEN20_05270 [Gammaproteobacteria bacterium]|nr:hypothetical protein [Gammaproteobacteria bacterium]
MIDRTSAFTELAQAAVQRVEHGLRQQLQDSLGEEGYAAFREWTSVRHAALAHGGMYQGHFRAENPKQVVVMFQCRRRRLPFGSHSRSVYIVTTGGVIAITVLVSTHHQCMA